MKPISVDLLELCRRGDQRAIRELYALLFGMLMAVSRRYYINKEDQNMATQDAFMKILNGLKNEVPSGNFEAWSRRILMNTIVDHFRKNKNRMDKIVSMDDNTSYDISIATFNDAEGKFQQEDLENMLQKLPSTTRYVFNLFAIEGYSHLEIAEALKISIGTSKWHVSEARRVLKEKLENKTGRG